MFEGDVGSAPTRFALFRRACQMAGMSLMQNPVFKAAIVVAAIPVLIAFAAWLEDGGGIRETLRLSALWVVVVFGAFFVVRWIFSNAAN